jgi:hypothetical protein
MSALLAATVADSLSRSIAREHRAYTHKPARKPAVKTRDHHPTHKILRANTAERTDSSNLIRTCVRLVCLILIASFLYVEGGKLADWLFVVLAGVETNLRIFLPRAS